LVPAINGFYVSDKELDSVSHMTEIGDLITGLTNDFHSFHKEFNEHFLAGTLDMMHNGMAVLMSNYGYDEQEAGNVLKQEVLAAEARLMAEYENWNSSESPKTDALRRYMFNSILTYGGVSYWQSATTRYQQTDLTATAADRAQLVGRGYDGKRRLPGYPPPAMAMTMKTNGHTESDSSSEASHKRTSAVAPLAREIVVPFEKAPAAEVSSHADHTAGMLKLIRLFLLRGNIYGRCPGRRPSAA
jgi:hypothetical protein